MSSCQVRSFLRFLPFDEAWFRWAFGYSHLVFSSCDESLNDFYLLRFFESIFAFSSLPYATLFDFPRVPHVCLLNNKIYYLLLFYCSHLAELCRSGHMDFIHLYLCDLQLYWSNPRLD